MRRTRLIWFALGAIVALLSWVLSSAFLSQADATEVPILVLSVPHIIDAGNNDELETLSLAAGERLQQCGAASFDIELRNDGFIYEVPITTETETVIGCLISEFGGSENEIALSIKVGNAQTH